MTDKSVEEAILQTIKAETKAFWDKDFDAWAKCWAHVPYTRTLGWWQAGGISVVEGWEAQSDLIRKVMAENPKPNPNATRVRRENLNIRVSAQMAWVTFDQYGEDADDPRMDMPGLSRETRILELIDGGWKIVYAGWVLQG